MNTLQQLKQYTKVVADTGDISSIKQYQPLDATTNPSLIFISAQDPQYRHLITDAINYAKSLGGDSATILENCMDKLSVNFGLEILKIVPGRVSTEVDARLSFDIEGSKTKARKIISLYEAAGVNKNRILIKIASTWQGIQTAKVLEKEGIHTNLTLLFSLTQAIACAQANITLISPFVGRILDWYKKSLQVDHIPINEDPGVLSVQEIYNYFKKFNYKTEVMGASFRNIDEIKHLAGCDLLTISPSLLSQLENESSDITPILNVEKAKAMNIDEKFMDEKTFLWEMNDNIMASEKLAEGIRAFSSDLVKLEKFISPLL